MPAQFRPPLVSAATGMASADVHNHGAGEEGEATVAPGRRLRILDVELYDTTLNQAAAWIILRARQPGPTTVGFVNAHFVNLFHRQPLLRNITRKFDRLFADGIGMNLAARISGFRLAENVNGTDLFPILCHEAARASVGVYLLGGQPGIAAAAAANMQKREPRLNVRGAASGYFASRGAEDEAIAAINASGARILLVGMGMPVQENWIVSNRHRLNPRVVIAVGGLFDFYSGRIQRAPKLFREIGLEWAWRLAMEPRRLFNRYVFGNVEFLARLLARTPSAIPSTTLTPTPQ